MLKKRIKTQCRKWNTTQLSYFLQAPSCCATQLKRATWARQAAEALTNNYRACTNPDTRIFTAHATQTHKHCQACTFPSSCVVLPPLQVTSSWRKCNFLYSQNTQAKAVSVQNSCNAWVLLLLQWKYLLITIRNSGCAVLSPHNLDVCNETPRLSTVINR